jgi:demethylmenaquinone methyltransferase/2-methoxy-6-polyprenyl-1,4-benzoquinol methylase
MTPENASAADLQAYYARRAAEYEAIYAKPERQADLARLRTDVAEAFRGRSVIEVACGTGYWTPHIARHAVRVDAFDINEETLAIARTKAVDPARVRFATADAYALPAAEPRYDGAFAGFWWSHVPRRDLPRFLQGLRRVLAPGARVVFLDNRYVPGSSTPLSRTDAQGDTFQARTLADGSRHEVLKNFPEPAELRAAVLPYADAAGAVEVRLIDYYWWLEYTLADAPR